MATMIDHDFAFRTLQDLVRIDSVNPSFAAGGGGEREIAGYVARTIAELGLEVECREPEPGRVSVLGRLRGRGGGRSLMLNAHLDTVGVDGLATPFTPTVRDGRLYGRGAYDMKGAVAACIAAAKALVDAQASLTGDVVLAAVADEEYASIGTSDIVANCSVDAAIVAEPTELRVCRAHKGFIWMEVETFGRAAHGSQFEQGVDANMRMGRFLGRLERLEQELRGRRPHPLVGPPSLHAGTLRGGVGLSVYAASCRLGIERRTVPGESAEQAVAEVRRLIDGLSAEDPSFRAELRVLLARDAFEVAEDAEIVRAVTEAVEHVTGEAPRHVGENPWMDSAILASAGVETVVIGPSGGGAHAADEWVDLQSVASLAEVLASTALIYCNGGPEASRTSAPPGVLRAET